MVARLGRRATEAALVLFAALGFCFVPLGKKTGLEHAKALLATDAAREAGEGVADAFVRVRQAFLQPATAPKAGPAASSSARDRPVLFRVSENAEAPDASAPYPPPQG
ncbi:MAG TPA: hypothetical protein PKD61_03595 [Polyangiaceae bacterium]|nr:hypothetical protein [Polyangiaceae bacterium]